MAKRSRVLNERRLTKKQVAELLTTGAIERSDLETAFVEADISLRPPGIYELPDGRILLVFNAAEVGVGGKGNIYDVDQLRRFIEWAARARDDARAGRPSSVSHWLHYSKARATLTARISPLLQELSQIILGPSSTLEITYPGLDRASQYIEAVGFERARQDIYDHLVAYVGEVIRSRTGGQWRIGGNGNEPYPYIAAAKHSVIMPVNVVWSELGGLYPADLRRETANEVRRTRAKY